MEQSVQSVLKPGDVIGKYKVVRCLGIGGMGEVHLVYHQQLKAYRALKLLRTDKVSRGSVSGERFMREARIASRVQHPNIVSVMDVENDPLSGFFYIVMEYIDGSNLNDVLQNGPLSEDQAVHIISEVSKGLGAASEVGLVHRDIKPANIMISQAGEVKLADLGIAKATGDDVGGTLTMDDTMVGTPAYSSPEQCRDAHDVDVRADIYSLGATLYEMVTGLPPFDGANAFDTIAHVLDDPPVAPRRLNPKISEGLEKLILKMLEKDPAARPQNIAELQELLKPFLATDIPPELKSLIREHVEHEIQARTSTMITAYRKKRRKELFAALAVAAVLLIVFALSFMILNRIYRQKIRKLEEQSARYRNENNELAIRVSSLKKQHERSLLESGDAVKKIRELTAEIDRLNKLLAERKTPKMPQSADKEKKDVPSGAPQTAAKEKKDVPSAAPQTVVKEKKDVPSAAPQTAAKEKKAVPAAAVPVLPPTPKLTPKEYLAKSSAAMRKLAAMRRGLPPDFQNEQLHAAETLDVAELKRLFGSCGVTFEDLSYLPPGAGVVSFIRSRFRLDHHAEQFYWLGILTCLPIPYNLKSPEWDTQKIHEYLTDCVRNGYCFDPTMMYWKPVSSPVPLENRKLERNYLDIMEFILTHPHLFRSRVEVHARLLSPGVFRKTILSRCGFRDFPEWADRLIKKGVFDASASSPFPILDYIYMSIHLKPKITPADLQLLERLEKQGFQYSLSPGDRKLIKAIREGDLDKVRQAVRQDHADVKKEYPFCESVLSFALAETVPSDIRIVRLLLKSGAPVNLHDSRSFYLGPISGKTPLARAIDRGNPELVKLLIDHKIKLDDIYALQAACRRGNAAMAELLLKNGTRPGSRIAHIITQNGKRKNFYVNDFLIEALKSKSRDIAMMLIRTEQIDLWDGTSGENPLLIAEADPSLAPVAVLIRQMRSSQSRLLQSKPQSGPRSDSRSGSGSRRSRRTNRR